MVARVVVGMTRVIVFGSRLWTDVRAIMMRLVRLPFATTLVHGACPKGADDIAQRVWRRWMLIDEPHPANWHPDGTFRTDYDAGFKRNEFMAVLGADLAIGFRAPGRSNGTDDMARRCLAHGIPLEKIGTWP